MGLTTLFIIRRLATDTAFLGDLVRHKLDRLTSNRYHPHHERFSNHARTILTIDSHITLERFSHGSHQIIMSSEHDEPGHPMDRLSFISRSPEEAMSVRSLLNPVSDQTIGSSVSSSSAVLDPTPALSNPLDSGIEVMTRVWDQPISSSPPTSTTEPIGWNQPAVPPTSNQPINFPSPSSDPTPLVYLDQLPHHLNGRSIYYKQPVESKPHGWPAWLKPMRRTKVVEDEKEEHFKVEWEWDRKPLPEVPRSREPRSSQEISSQGASSHRPFYTVRDLLRDSGITEFGKRDTSPENELLFFGTLDKELVRMIDRRGPPGDCAGDDAGPRITEPLNLKRKRGMDVSEEVNTSDTFIMDEPHGTRLGEHSHIHYHPYRPRDERRNAVVLPNSEVWVNEQAKEDERVRGLMQEQRARSKRRKMGPGAVEDKAWSGSRNATM